MNLYAHQQKIIEDDPKWSLIALGTGGGKTRVCLELAESPVLIICPKQQKLDRTWENNAEKFGIILNMKVVSKEEFRRDWVTYDSFRTVIVDECHNMLGVMPMTRQRNKVKIPKASQMFESLLNYIRKYPPVRFYMASATPVTKPMHLWALATLFGRTWDFYAFRAAYYIERRMGLHMIWIPKMDAVTKDRLAKVTKTFGYTGKLQDWFDVPEQTHEIIHLGLTSKQMSAINALEYSEADPLVKRGRKRTIENGVLYTQEVETLSPTVDKLVKSVDIFPSEKIDYILERAEEFPKLLIFANYIAQINQIADHLAKAGYYVVTLTGQTKNRGLIIQEAEASAACIVVAQCSISSGYELPSFPCVIYASKSYRYVDYSQSLGRVLRANALKKNLYLHLVISGGVDEDCHNTIMQGRDFEERVMTN